MKIIVANPPCFDQIKAAFPGATGNVIFTFGQVIYNPRNVPVSKELLAHEQIHGDRQDAYPGGWDAWWGRYLKDPQFRLEEELPAHQAQYHARVRRHGPDPKYLQLVAEALSGPLYGGIIDLKTARHLILTRGELNV